MVACGTSIAEPSPAATVTLTASVTITRTSLPSATATPTQVPTSEPTATPFAQYEGCNVTHPPAELGLDPFYEKHCTAFEIPILSSANVPDLALSAAADIVAKMLADLPLIRSAMIENGLTVAVIGKDQVTTDMPEYRNLDELFPNVNWDRRTRGIGATTFIPLATGAEENLLCYSNDRYRGESIFLHEFAHTIMDLGLAFVDNTILPSVEDAFNRATNEGIWKGTYAGTNAGEYWAEGVQSYFDSNLQADPPDGIHNFVNTREELREYDPQLFDLIAGVFGSSDWTPGCPLE